MKPQKFIIFVHPSTNWLCRVVVHPNQQALDRTRKKLNPKETGSSKAFFWHGKREEQFKGREKVFGELHFNRKNIGRNYVVHEAVHAAVEYSWLCQLDTYSDKAGEEHFAEVVETIWKNTHHGLHKYCRLTFPK